MNIGELRQHPDFHKLVDGIEFQLDTHVRLVLVSARKGTLEDVRSAVAKYDVLLELQSVLKGGQDA